MALTLAESAKLSTDMVLAGVIETIIKEEHVLDQLPFVEVVGNNFVYNRLNTEPAISFFNVGDSWTESTPDFTQISVQLKILGGDADVDNFIERSRAHVQDIQSAVVQQKAKALARKWADTFVNGDTSVDAKSFDGIDKICGALPAAQTVSMGTNGATLTRAKLDELIDAVKTKNIALALSRGSRRTVQSLMRSSGAVLGLAAGSVPGVGADVQRRAGHQRLHLGREDGGHLDRLLDDLLLLAGGGGPGRRWADGAGRHPDRERGRARVEGRTRHRVKWYTSIAVLSTLSLVRLTGVRP